MAILAVGGLLFQPLIGVLARTRGLVVPDAGSLSVLIWAQVIGLVLLLPLAWRSREEPPASDLKTI